MVRSRHHRDSLSTQPSKHRGGREVCHNSLVAAQERASGALGQPVNCELSPQLRGNPLISMPLLGLGLHGKKVAEKVAMCRDEAVGNVGRRKHVDGKLTTPAEPVESAQDLLQHNFATRDVIQNEIGDFRQG